MLGNLGDRWWGSFWEYEPEGGSFNHLFGLVTVEGVDAGQVGRELIDKINHNIFFENGEEKWVAMVISRERVFMRGEGFRIYLVRGEKMALIFRGGNPVGGRISEKDRFLLVSEKLKNRITDEKMGQILAEKTVDRIAEKIKEQIFLEEGGAGLASALIEIGQESFLTEEKTEMIKPKWKMKRIKIPKMRMGWWFQENGINNKWNLWFSVTVLILLAVGIAFGYQKKRVIVKPVAPETAKIVDEKTKETENAVYEFIYNTDLTGNGGKNYENIVIKGDKAYIADRGSGRIDRIDWKLKSAEKILTDEKIKGISEITLDNDKLLAFDGQSIWEIKKDGVKEVGKVNTQNLIKLRVWNGGWYFLADDGGIWKKDTSGEVKQWILDKRGLVAGANDMAIDGKIWVSNALGELKQYQLGKEENWKSSVKPAELDFFRVLTRAEGNRVVLVSRKKLWSFDKAKGMLVGTFNLEKVGVKDAAITDDGKDVIVLGQDQKIYKVKLSGEIL